MALPFAPTLPDGFRHFLESGEYSDFTIICGERKFALHKVVIFSQSKVLKASCSSGFKESRTNMIDLSHDSLHLLERMIGYFYSGIYEGLTDKDATPGSHLTLHVEMFAFADKYDVPGLGEQASCHFQALLHKVRHVAECLSCVCAVYESTPHSNTRLRDLIVNHVVKLYVAEWEMSEPLLKAAFIETPQFGWDCFLQLQRNSISKDQWAAWNTLLQSRPTPYEKI